MPIDQFRRTSNYFSSKVKIRSSDVDSQFNYTVSFVNNKLLPVINNLIYEQFIGTDNPALQNAFLTNTGDGTTKWDFIKADSFLYNGLSLIKIEKAIDNSVLASNSAGNYVYITPLEGNQTLKSVLADSPVFGKITGSCFEARSVLGRHIALDSIGADNLTAETYSIPDNSIQTIKFTDSCVTTNTLQDGDVGIGLTADRLTDGVRAVFPTMITSNMLYDGYLSSHFDVIFSGVNAYSNLTAPEYERIMDLSNTQYPWDKISGFSSLNVKNYNLNNVALNNINGERLHYLNTTTNKWYPRDDDLLENGSIYPEHLTPDLRALLDL